MAEKRLLHLDKTGKIIDSLGRVIFYPTDQFIEEICRTDRCFICGRAESDIQFNKEHVLPDWILKKYSLHSKKIDLINNTGYTYGRYVIPCCVECNHEMGKKVEEPIKKLLELDFKQSQNELLKGGHWLLLQWLSLIFFKTHYKDLFLRYNLDFSKENVLIGDLHEWKELHHIYCVARAWYAKSSFENSAWSTMLMLPVAQGPYYSDFDFCDLSNQSSLMIRLGDRVILSVLNDSCGVLNIIEEDLKKITAPLSPVQIRELFAKMSFINTILVERPEFISEIDRSTGTHIITSKMPQYVEIGDYNLRDYGKILYRLTKDHIALLPEENQSYITQQVKNGTWTYILNSDGEFDDSHINQ